MFRELPCETHQHRRLDFFSRLHVSHFEPPIVLHSHPIRATAAFIYFTVRIRPLGDMAIKAPRPINLLWFTEKPHHTNRAPQDAGAELDQGQTPQESLRRLNFLVGFSLVELIHAAPCVCNLLMEHHHILLQTCQELFLVQHEHRFLDGKTRARVKLPELRRVNLQRSRPAPLANDLHPVFHLMRERRRDVMVDRRGSNEKVPGAIRRERPRPQEHRRPVAHRAPEPKRRPRNGANRGQRAQAGFRYRVISRHPFPI